MKSTILWVVRHLLIPVGFMLITGIPQKAFHFIRTSDSDPFPHGAKGLYSEAELSTLEFTPSNYKSYTDSIKKSREQLSKKNAYSLFLYFRDLKQTRMFQAKYYHQLDSTRWGRFMYTNTETLFINELHNMSIKQDGFIYDKDSIDAARHYWFPRDAAADKYIAEHPIQVGSAFKKFIIAISCWSWGVYWKGLSLAFVLFLIWKLNLKKDFEEELHYGAVPLKVSMAPLSFIISVLLWPIILWIDLRLRFKQFMRKAEVVSRRNKMLSLFSKQEEALVRLGMTMTQSEFGLHLDNIGLKRQHSLGLACGALIFITLLPALVSAQSAPLEHVKKPLVVLKIPSAEHHVLVKIKEKPESPESPPSLVNDVAIIQLFQQLFHSFQWLYKFDFSPDIGKVPLCVIATSNLY